MSTTATGRGIWYKAPIRRPDSQGIVQAAAWAVVVHWGCSWQISCLWTGREKPRWSDVQSSGPRSEPIPAPILLVMCKAGSLQMLAAPLVAVCWVVSVADRENRAAGLEFGQRVPWRDRGDCRFRLGPPEWHPRCARRGFRTWFSEAAGTIDRDIVDWLSGKPGAHSFTAVSPRHLLAPSCGGLGRFSTPNDPT